MCLFFLFSFLYKIKNKVKIKVILDQVKIKIKNNLKQFIIFSSLFLLLNGTFLVIFLSSLKNEPLESKTESIEKYSLDFLSIFIYGGASKHKDLTSWHWEKLGNPVENSVHLGFILPIIIIFIFIYRKHLKLNDRSYFNLCFWFFSFGFFLILSFRPIFKVNTLIFNLQFMPYRLLTAIFPFLNISRTPVRYFLISILSASIIFAFLYSFLNKKRTIWSKSILYFFIFIIIIELLPSKIFLTSIKEIKIPYYFSYIQDTPSERVIVDKVSSRTLKLYYQTIHQKKIDDAYISRVPESVAKRNSILKNYLKDYSANQKIPTEKYKIKYILFNNNKKRQKEQPGEIFRNDETIIIDLDKTN